VSETLVPGDRVEILEGAVLAGDPMDITITELTLATVVKTDGKNIPPGLWVILDVEPEIPWGGGGRDKERWYCYAHEVRAWTPEREAIQDQLGYDS
jgi:hypothetical protein